jgi:multidrug efflux system membrane fusion protein
MRAIVSYGTAGAILVVGALWLGSGTLVVGGNGPGNGEKPVISLIDKNAKLAEAHESEIDPKLTIAERVAEASGAEGPARSVRTVTYSMEPLAIEIPLRGKTQAKWTVSVMPETQGVVDEIHVQKGQQVQAGDLICTIDEGTRQSAVDQAESAVAQAQSAFDTNQSLKEKGLAANNSSLVLEVALRQAKAALLNAQTELERTQVKTKVAGVVQDPLATVGSMLAAGSPCATIVQLDPMLFVASVPEAHIGLAKLGLHAAITTVSGQKAEGKVTYLASVADPATRSFGVEIELANADGKILDGLTANATVSVGTAPATLLPQSVLTLDDDGVLGVRTVTKDNKVEFYAITIVKSTREGIWVTGLPPQADVITVGQDFVQAGQTVTPTNVPASEATGAKPGAATEETASESAQS